MLFLMPVLTVQASANLTIQNTNLTTDQQYTTVVNQAIKEASGYIVQQGVSSEWEAIGLAKTNKEIPRDYSVKFMENLQDQVISKSGKGRMKITDVERLTMAAIAIGKDPTNVDGKGFNLIEKIYNAEPWSPGVDSLTFQGNNGIIFALIALDTKNYAVPNNAKWTREKLVAELLKYQKSDGSWSLTTTTTDAASFDITAMALSSLAPYGDNPVVKAAIDKSVQFLSNEQGSTGGFSEEFVGGVSSEATAQVIIGLTANKIDPRSQAFTKNGTNLIDHLLSFKDKTGGFKHTAEDSSPNSIATEQALQALVAFDLYRQGKGALYDFSNQGAPTEPLPEPNPVTFTDVEGHWAKDLIYQAAQLGIVSGYQDGRFKPENKLTRVQAVAVIVRGLNLKTTDSAPFKDIGGYGKETQAEIAAAYKYGLVKKLDGNFNPSNKVTRAQMALMLQRAYEQKTNKKYVISKVAPYSDYGKYNEETVHAITMLYELGIATGSNGLYNPSNDTSRAHAAKMLVNFMSALEK